MIFLIIFLSFFFTVYEIGAFLEKSHVINLDQNSQKNRSEETYLKRGFDLLSQDKPFESIEWFEKVSPYNEEAIAGKVYAAFSLQSWKEVVEGYYRLSPPFLSIDAFHGFAIEALTELGKIDEAEEILKNLIERSSEEPDDVFTPYFLEFKRAKLNQWNRYFIAGLFSKMIKKDNEEALKFFEQIKDSTPLMEIEKAELLIDLGMLEKAKITIINSKKKISENTDKLKIKPRLLPLLAEAYAKVGFFAEAASYYKEYFKMIFPENADSIYRLDYARVLMKIGRCDLALAEFNIHLRNESPTPEDGVAFLTCLVHTGQFARANRLALEWEKFGLLPLLQRLQITRLMLITQNQYLIETVLDDVAETTSRSIEENSELLRLWVELGNFADATILVEELEQRLEKIPSGLLALAIYNEKLSHFDKALIFAQKAAQLDPYNIEITRFLERYERSLNSIQGTIKQLKEELSLEPDSITIKLLYAKNLLDLFTTQAITQHVEQEQSIELRTVEQLLEPILSINKQIPEIFFLLGKVMFLLNNDEKAKEFYLIAIRLDPSYVEAYQNLAFIYEGENNLKKAEAALKNGIRFRPYDAELWQQLGLLRFKGKNYRGSISAFTNAIKYVPNDPSPLVDLSKTYIETKQFMEALQLLEKAQLLSEEKGEILKLKLFILHNPLYKDK